MRVSLKEGKAFRVGLFAGKKNFEEGMLLARSTRGRSRGAASPLPLSSPPSAWLCLSCAGIAAARRLSCAPRGRIGPSPCSRRSSTAAALRPLGSRLHPPGSYLPPPPPSSFPLLFRSHILGFEGFLFPDRTRRISHSVLSQAVLSVRCREAGTGAASRRCLRARCGGAALFSPQEKDSLNSYFPPSRHLPQHTYFGPINPEEFSPADFPGWAPPVPPFPPRPLPGLPAGAAVPRPRPPSQGRRKPGRAGKSLPDGEEPPAPLGTTCGNTEKEAGRTARPAPLVELPGRRGSVPGAASPSPSWGCEEGTRRFGCGAERLASAGTSRKSAADARWHADDALRGGRGCH